MLLIKNNKVYDILKYIAQILLPAAGTLYYSLAQLWDFPNPDKVVGSIVVIDAFLGVILHLSSTAYDQKFDGTLEVTETPEKKSFMLNFDNDPSDLDKQEKVVLKVNSTAKVTVKPKKRTKSSPK